MTNTCQTSGIYVFEHTDDNNLDVKEQKILENLRKAHEEWMENNSESKKVTKKVTTFDPFPSVKVRI